MAEHFTREPRKDQAQEMTETSNDDIFSRIGRGITRARNFTFNALFLVVLLALILALFADDTPAVPEDSALLVNPRGVLVEQRGVVDPLAQFFSPNSPREIELREITGAIELAAEDDRIHLAVLDLDELSGLSVGQAVVVGDAILDPKFREWLQRVPLFDADRSADLQKFLGYHSTYVPMCGTKKFQEFIGSIQILQNLFRRQFQQVQLCPEILSQPERKILFKLDEFSFLGP